jgi:hypothetical protein
MPYKSLIRSTLDYGCQAHNSGCKTYLQRLDWIQQSALKIALGAHRSTEKAVLLESGELPLNLRRIQLSLNYWVRISTNTENPVNKLLQLPYTHIHWLQSKETVGRGKEKWSIWLPNMAVQKYLRATSATFQMLITNGAMDPTTSCIQSVLTYAVQSQNTWQSNTHQINCTAICRDALPRVPVQNTQMAVKNPPQAKQVLLSMTPVVPLRRGIDAQTISQSTQRRWLLLLHYSNTFTTRDIREQSL